MLKKNKWQKYAAFLMAVACAVSLVKINDVLGISKACQNSPECLAAIEREQEANRNAAEAANTASMYQNKVNELNAEIAAKEAEIIETEAEITELTRQIEEAEKKLLEEQNALAELLIDMHFEEEIEPIMVLAGSSSLSDLAEKQAREEVIKDQISASAAKVKKNKEKLEEDKIQVENLLDQQQNARESLIARREEQRTLVEKYQNDIESYTRMAEDAKRAKQEAERIEQETHPELYRGSAFTGDNTYPWQNECPGAQDNYETYWEDAYGWHDIGGYVCECVSYVGWKAYEAYGIALSYGNAYDWAWKAERWGGYRVDGTPTAGSIGQTSNGIYGHVFWVESVNSDGSINVTEYNNSWATYLYSGDSHYGDFGSRQIAAGDIWQYRFIHLD